MVLKKKKEVYEKHHSFEYFYSNKSDDIERIQKERAIRLLRDFDAKEDSVYFSDIISKCLSSLESDDAKFIITRFIAEEMDAIEDKDIPLYLFHRYRYDIYPKERILDDYPPYLQIEPTSICNYKCVFCYQVDPYFKNKENLGNMDYSFFKDIIDEVSGNVEFISIASRGEPLACRDIDKMLEYTSGKFLSLKLNTNASLLNERHAHALLSGGVKTLVFSADAADKELYGKLRVNGDLNKVLKNIEMFQKIKSKHYSDSKLITRVSGVMVNDDIQNMDDMKSFWGALVDQITFVRYNPWEDMYNADVNNIKEPCSELWRKMFIWHNGYMNSCDCDYKSTLANINYEKGSMSSIWNSQKMNELRELHLNGKRNGIEPCKRCRFL